MLKGLPLFTLLLHLPITKNIKHKGYEFTLSCCSPNSHNVHSWLSRLGSATSGPRAVKSPGRHMFVYEIILICKTTFCIRFGEETWTYMKLISHNIYRLSPAQLVVFAGVLNNKVESSEDTKVVREVTDVFLHEEYDDGTLSNDIAIIKVWLFSMNENKIFYVLWIGNIYVKERSLRYKYLG